MLIHSSFYLLLVVRLYEPLLEPTYITLNTHEEESNEEQEEETKYIE